MPVEDPADIERALASLGAGGNGGLVVNSDIFAARNRAAIIAAAARQRVPAIYPFVLFVADGGSGRLRHRRQGFVPPRRRLRRSHPQGRETGRPAASQLCCAPSTTTRAPIFTRL